VLAANLSRKQIGDFVLEDRIGRGGMAMVYRAFQSSVNRHVAVKIMPLDIDDEFRVEYFARFDQEANVIASLEHIHILPIYSYGIHENEYSYLAMRLMRGGTLADLLRNGPLPLERAAAIFTQIGRALQYAHDRGIIHRDLKPSNILLDEAGNAYLSDFGLAKVVEMSLDLTRSGNLVGTPAYVAPELVRGEAATLSSDIYSLGIILYHMLAGRPPFEQSETGGVLALLYKHVEQEPPPLREINPDIPPEIEAITMQALKKSPNQRYKSAQAMVMDLDGAIGYKRITGSNPAIHAVLPTPPHLQSWRRNRILWVMAGVVLLLIVGGFVLSRVNSEPPPAIILLGERGTIETLVPSDSEVGLARERLGQNGFIAYIACTLNDGFQSRRAIDIEEIANSYALPYRTYDSQSDIYTQITQIDRARLEGAKAFILCPLSASALDESLLSMQQAQFPVVFVTLYEHPYGVKLDSDNYEVGLRIGQYAGEIIRDEWNGQANVLLLGFPGFPASDRRLDGIEDAMREIVPTATIIAREQGYTREEAAVVVQRLLQQGEDINLIASINDAGSMGAVDALQEAGIPPDSMDIVSSNAEAPVLDLIREGMYIRGSLAINREQLSRLAVFGIIKQLAGATVPEYFTYPPGDMITAETLAAQAE
jgi:ABC-type sugar transport system substrate-binding protein